ncbi:UNVERIFIED_CONTAM: Acidic endochitinase [Sesamum latifolium]|uniref:Acidic endochitinase n=1 Tax=Sesamum latifolium TaxID=2727402 RepID=A0AAW2XHU8_9LAMI
MAADYSQSSTKTLLIILSIFIAFSLFNFRSSEACGVSTYWGQKSSQGSLQELCETGYFKYVNIGFLSQFGCGRTPVLNLDGHCDPSSGACTSLSAEIRSCQSLDIKVQLSLGGPLGNYGLCSADDAHGLVSYLLRTYLAPGATGPLGDAPLDGIDLAIENTYSTLYWDDLVTDLATIIGLPKKVYLSAAPSCPYPDPILGKAIGTGHVDNVWVKLYDNAQCDCDAGIPNVLASWLEWSHSLPAASQLFFGLAPNSQCPLDQILAAIKLSTNYGGVMLSGGINDYPDIPHIHTAACGYQTLSREGSLMSMVD